MWIIFIFIFVTLLVLLSLAYLLFSKIINYVKIEDTKTSNKIKRLTKEREEKN